VLTASVRGRGDRPVPGRSVFALIHTLNAVELYFVSDTINLYFLFCSILRPFVSQSDTSGLDFCRGPTHRHRSAKEVDFQRLREEITYDKTSAALAAS
jgi:hypothetical protein